MEIILIEISNDILFQTIKYLVNLINTLFKLTETVYIQR